MLCVVLYARQERLNFDSPAEQSICCTLGGLPESWRDHFFTGKVG